MKRIALIVGIFLVSFFSFIHPAEGYYGGQTQHEGGVHFTPNYGISGIAGDEGDVGDQSGWFITLEAGHSSSPLPPVFRQPLHQFQGPIWQLDRMTPRHFVALFAMRGWNADQILSNPTWYMYDSFITVVKQLPQYGMHLDRLYKRWHNVGDEEKIKGWLTSEYVAGLEDRIIFLKKENDLIQDRKRDEHVRKLRIQEQQEAWHTVQQTFESQQGLIETAVTDYQLVYESDYYYEVLNHNDRCIKREYAFEEIATSDAKYTKQSYTISQDVRTVLETSCSPGKYTTCYGNQLQQVIHQDCIDLLQDTAAMPLHSPFREHTSALVDLVDAAREYNQAGECTNAIEINDLCCVMVSYGQAIAQGAVQGLAGVVEYSIEHPIETVAMVVAPEAALMYQLGKVVHDVAKIGIAYVHDRQAGKEQLTDYIAPLTDLINACNNNQLTGPEIAQGAVQFAVGWKAHNKLLGGLGTLYGGVRNKAGGFLKQNRTTTLQEYVQTTEGQLLRVVNPETEREYEKLIELSKQQGQKKLQNGTTGPAAIKNSATGNSSIEKPLVYMGSDEHAKISIGNKSAAPKNGQKALNNSFPVKGNSKAKVAICDGEIVALRLTGNFHDRIEYHGHIMSSKDLEKRHKFLDTLLKKGLVNKHGRILKNE